MKVQDIILQAMVHKKMNIDSVYGRTHINEAMHQLAAMYDTAKIRDTQTIVCTDDEDYFDLPSSCIKILRVDQSDGTEYDSWFYKVESGQIKFRHTDTYTVTFLKEPGAILNDFDVPGINEMYHRTIAKFIASRELDEIKPQKSEKLYNEFLAEASSINKELSGSKKRFSIAPVQRFR